MSRYVCYTQWNRRWVEAVRFEAADMVEAYARLRDVLPFEHCGRPIALEVEQPSPSTPQMKRIPRTAPAAVV